MTNNEEKYYVIVDGEADAIVDSIAEAKAYAQEIGSYVCIIMEAGTRNFVTSFVNVHGMWERY